MTALVTIPKPTQDLREAHIAAMWILFLAAPSKRTGPGEPVDLGDIGEVREFKVNRMTPYSISEPSTFYTPTFSRVVGSRDRRGDGSAV